MLQREHHLDDGQHSSAAARMPYIGLAGADIQRFISSTCRTEHCGKRTRFDRIAQQGACTMRFDNVDVAWHKSTRGERASDDTLLARAIRSSQPMAPSVLVDCAAANDSENRIPIALRIRKPLEDK
ncbi:hypothetical protein LV564_12435 [Komagataeibacter nataicola]|nr:hypothetical protein [Komagataeibacter nataicola]WEQ57440.1 hypothetical protein LV564_12435 [Komagataeibacter nataicola]